MDDETEDMGYLAEVACHDLARTLQQDDFTSADRKTLLDALRRFMRDAKKGADS